MATRLLNTAKRKTEKERLSTLPQPEKASRVLARAAKVLLEELELVEEHGADLDVAALWAAVEEAAPRAAVLTAAATVVSLVPGDEGSAEVAMRAALANRYATVRPFLALLGESKALDAASAGRRVLAGARGLPALARRKTGVKPLLPREVDDRLVPPAWRKAVYANPDLPRGAVDRDAYVVCVLGQPHRALNNRDVFASPSRAAGGKCRSRASTTGATVSCGHRGPPRCELCAPAAGTVHPTPCDGKSSASRTWSKRPGAWRTPVPGNGTCTPGRWSGRLSLCRTHWPTCSCGSSRRSRSWRGRHRLRRCGPHVGWR
ncbi:hypothetical protein SUDANB180_01187 [Streptomyces sp. enrichment culture]